MLGYIDIFELSQGRVFFPDLIRGLVEQYRFQKYPTTFEEANLATGIEFLNGVAGKQPIQKFAIWDSLLVVETTSGTDDSKAVMEQILLWGTERFGLNYSAGAMKRFAYVSDIAFYSDAPILEINSAVSELSNQVGEALSEIWHESIVYESLSLRIGHDPLSRKYDIAPFTIERRGGVRFSENKYFSEAPLPTLLHLNLLNEFEQKMLKIKS